MKPAPFRYERADSVRGTLQFLDAERERAKIIAGGQSLVALMNLRLSRPEILLDIAQLDELRYQRVIDGTLEIGALTTQAEVEKNRQVSDVCPLLAEAVPHVGHAAIRNRGTIGGSIAHADPAAEPPAVLAALGGSVVLRSTNGERQVAAEDFFRGFLMTTAEPNEIVTSVRFPTTGAGEGTAFEEFARRPGDFALVSVAAVVGQKGGTVKSACLALGGVGGVPFLVPGLEDLVGESGPASAERAARIAAEAIDPVSDLHGTAEYRRHLTRELVKRAFSRALDV